MGTQWSYSDSGYLLLGLVIESALKQTYYELVGDLFLEPLRLNRTSPSNQTRLKDLAVGYTTENNPFGLPARTVDRDGKLYWNPSIEWTSGGLVSTAGDLAKWGHHLFSGGALPEPYLDRLLQSVDTARGDPNSRYGAGVAITLHTSHGVVYGHGGWVPGYVSSLRHYKDRAVTIAFQINSDVEALNQSTRFIDKLEAALSDAVLAFPSSQSAFGAPDQRSIAGNLFNSIDDPKQQVLNR